MQTKWTECKNDNERTEWICILDWPNQVVYPPASSPPPRSCSIFIRLSMVMRWSIFKTPMWHFTNEKCDRKTLSIYILEQKTEMAQRVNDSIPWIFNNFRVDHSTLLFHGFMKWHFLLFNFWHSLLSQKMWFQWMRCEWMRCEWKDHCTAMWLVFVFGSSSSLSSSLTWNWKHHVWTFR